MFFLFLFLFELLQSIESATVPALSSSREPDIESLKAIIEDQFRLIQTHNSHFQTQSSHIQTLNSQIQT